MPMGTRGNYNAGREQRDAADEGPKGADFVATPDRQTNGAADSGTHTQSPAGLQQPKGPKVVGTFSGAEKGASN